ncbi:MAG: cytochrome c family protein [Alphaproteobacteria bacterium]|nr:cytochrome c family protein [Alphaproteobacteria bacterium]
MDSFEFNKMVAAILIALLTVKGASLISEILIHPHMLKENVFKIAGVEATQTADGGSAQPKGPAPIEPLLASASAEKGAQVFKKCASCHTIDAGGANRVGPNLHNIVGAQRAKHPGYAYSQAMEQKGGSWSYDDLNIYLYNPRHFVPGTKMSFAGIKDDKERADLIAYLRQETDNPPPIPDAPAASPGTPAEKPAALAPTSSAAVPPISASPVAPEHSPPQENKR